MAKIGPPSRMGDLEPAATIRLGDSARSTPTAADEVRKTLLFMPARLTQFAAAQAKPLPHPADCLLHGQTRVQIQTESEGTEIGVLADA